MGETVTVTHWQFIPRGTFKRWRLKFDFEGIDGECIAWIEDAQMIREATGQNIIHRTETDWQTFRPFDAVMQWNGHHGWRMASILGEAKTA